MVADLILEFCFTVLYLTVTTTYSTNHWPRPLCFLLLNACILMNKLWCRPHSFDPSIGINSPFPFSFKVYLLFQHWAASFPQRLESPLSAGGEMVRWFAQSWGPMDLHVSSTHHPFSLWSTSPSMWPCSNSINASHLKIFEVYSISFIIIGFMFWNSSLSSGIRMYCSSPQLSLEAYRGSAINLYIVQYIAMVKITTFPINECIEKWSTLLSLPFPNISQHFSLLTSLFSSFY